MFGLFTKKGTIVFGSDADSVFCDTEEHSRCRKYSLNLIYDKRRNNLTRCRTCPCLKTANKQKSKAAGNF